MEISLVAKRKGMLGLLGPILQAIKPDDAGVVVHEGISFGEASADIRVGGRVRSVGIFGTNSDAGVIDLTESIKRGADGHPTFESVEKETGAILQDFYATIQEKKP